MTPDEFVKETISKPWNMDDAFGCQCWDLMAKHCQMVGIPLGVIHCSTTGYVIDLWTNRHTNGILNYFDEVHQPYQDGDWCIFGTDYYATPKSHVAMRYGDKFFDQTTKRGCAGYSVLDPAQALGGFRWKGWSTVTDDFRYGLNYRNFEDADLVIFKAYDGYGLYMLSAGEGVVKDIQDFDNEKLLIVAATNANYFQMQTGQPDRYGTHYGVEQTYDGTDLAPKKEGLLAYYDSLNEGIQLTHSSSYWLSRDEVHWACTPYSVVRHKGVSVNIRSTDLGNKEGEKNTQTMIARINDHWFFILCRSKVLPSVMARYAEALGADEAMLMDSGGSSQLMAWNGSKYSAEIYTGRHIPNVFVIAKEKTADLKPIDEHDPGDEQEPIPFPDPSETASNDEEDEMNNIPKTLLPDRVYDILKWVALICLPALSAFVLFMGRDLSADYEVIAKWINAIAILLGSLIGVSTVQYNSAKERQDE